MSSCVFRSPIFGKSNSELTEDKGIIKTQLLCEDGQFVVSVFGKTGLVNETRDRNVLFDINLMTNTGKVISPNVNQKTHETKTTATTATKETKEFAPFKFTSEGGFRGISCSVSSKSVGKTWLLGNNMTSCLSRFGLSGKTNSTQETIFQTCIHVHGDSLTSFQCPNSEDKLVGLNIWTKDTTKIVVAVQAQFCGTTIMKSQETNNATKIETKIETPQAETKTETKTRTETETEISSKDSQDTTHTDVEVDKTKIKTKTETEINNTRESVLDQIISLKIPTRITKLTDMDDPQWFENVVIVILCILAFICAILLFKSTF